ncbi:hypothetical protein HYT55_01700 [Candidatus Woesearchaeota archaeon]|nr:hypothetical protein [Candidatus Woesearchaeota archaeon]
MIEMQQLTYSGKHYSVPLFSTENPIIFTPNGISDLHYSRDARVIKDLNTLWDLEQFKIPRVPVSFGYLPEEQRDFFSRPGVTRVLDMPIRFPGTDYRLPKELAQFKDVISRVANIEEAINPQHSVYYCYLTIDQRTVKAGTLHREAPCHVDGFQGARWPTPLPINHTYTISDTIPTVYYPQPFFLDNLDIAKHDFFWEFNRQVAMANSQSAIRFSPFELTLMNAYCVHRGDDAVQDTCRTWLRLSYEVRIFDRLGNAHNPLFDYDWKMVERDIEQLNLVPYDQNCDPSLRVFPWQSVDGLPNPHGVKTKPNLKKLK